MTRLLWLGLLAGCTQDLAINDAPCPCLEGYQCCEARCLPIGEACGDPAPLRLLAAEPPEAPVAGGTRIRLVGAGFRAPISVRFGGRPAAEVSVITEESLEVVVPPGPADWGAVDVVIEHEGTVATLPFRYVLAPFVDASATAGLGGGFGLGMGLWDADDDGLWELALARWESSDGFLHANQGGLRWAPMPAPADLPGHFHVWPADFSGDGVVDLAVAAVEEPLLRVYSGGAAWRSLGPSQIPRLAEEVLTAGIADYDADGDLDLLACRATGYEVSPPARLVAPLENDAGRFTEALDRVVTEPGRGQGCGQALAGDIDQDGDADLLTCGLDLRLFLNDDGHFNEVTTAWKLPTQLAPACHSLALVDFDADGDLDLVWSRSGDPSDPYSADAGLSILRNTGRQFTPVLDLEAPGDAVGCAEDRAPGAALARGRWVFSVFDADLDGDLDIFVPQPSAACLTPMWYENRHLQGEPFFRAHPIAATGLTSVSAVGAADLDGDADLDVVLHLRNQAWPNRVFRNNIFDNAGTSAGPGGRALFVRALTDADGDATDAQRADDRDAWGATVLVVQEGGRLARVIGESGTYAVGPATLHFGLSAGPAEVQVRFPDGSLATATVDAATTHLELRDCAQATCAAP